MTVACCWCMHALWCPSLHSRFTCLFFFFFLSICSWCHPDSFQSFSRAHGPLAYPVSVARERQKGEDHLSVWQESVESGVWLTADSRDGVADGGEWGAARVVVRWWDSCGSGLFWVRCLTAEGLMFRSCGGSGRLHWSLVLLRRCSFMSIFYQLQLSGSELPIARQEPLHWGEPITKLN